jgi:AbrB family looped-hinge helix DNA binding protein
LKLLLDKCVSPLTPMTTATVTSKGQITIPLEVRQALQLQPGDRIEFVEVQAGRFEVVAVTGSVRQLKGLFKAVRAVSIEKMRRAVASRGAAAR